MMTESVKLMRELNTIDKERNYFHNTDVNVICQIKKVKNFAILRDHAHNFNEGQLIAHNYILVKVIDLLIEDRSSISLNENQNAILRTILDRSNNLDMYSDIVMHLLDKEKSPLSKNRVNEIICELKKISENNSTIEVDENASILILDDGLNEVPVIVKNKLLSKNIKTGDKACVHLLKNINYSTEKGYMIVTPIGPINKQILSIDIL